MASFDSGRREQDKSAAGRVSGRTKDRRARIKELRTPGGIARADDPQRVATRIDRLSHYHPDVRPIPPSEIVAQEPEAMRAAGAVLERIINTEDFLGVGYLEGGVAAARAVGRVNIRDDRGRLAGYGTGSMVSPSLLLTNHHVLPSDQVAASSSIEFGYQDGPDGLPLQPTVFPFDPGRFFLADEELDFALVAVGATPEELTAFGYNPLIGSEGKAIVGDFVTIIQHPGGEKKQVALRENRIVDLIELFLHYETDTEPGSSGSPVFNDQWEVVALHHASVPAPEKEELGGIVNEGARVSRLLAFTRDRSQSLPPDRQALLAPLIAEESTITPPAPTVASAEGADERPPEGTVVPSEPQTMRVDVPLEITLRTPDLAPGARPGLVGEAITIDPDYSTREGYDPEFLGSESHSVPLPILSPEAAAIAAENTAASAEPRYVLPYHHFSVVMNKERRLAFFTAVNIDGTTSIRIRRESDRWFMDPRIPEEEQAGEEVYSDNPLDRGHLVRRLDPAWGPSESVAKLSNDDTFHFTNCTPQHADFNQNQTTWAGLEDYILENADNREFKVSVFTGPVFADDDDEYRGVALPRQFWKVAAMIKESGELSATAYLLSQEQLIEGLEVAVEEFSYGEYRTYQVPVRRIEELTGLSFGSLADADPLEQMEAATPFKEVTRPEELTL
jgi:endonuclease G, mitochondrial